METPGLPSPGTHSNGRVTTATRPDPGPGHHCASSRMFFSDTQYPWKATLDTSTILAWEQTGQEEEENTRKDQKPLGANLKQHVRGKLDTTPMPVQLEPRAVRPRG